MTYKNNCITLWVLQIIGMILHFNYHIGGLFYGVEIASNDANGIVPNSTHIIRTIFYHLPIIWVLILLHSKNKWIYLSLFILSLLYAFAHGSHLLKETAYPINYSQVPLLALVFVSSILLSFNHWKLYKEEKN